MDVNKVLKNHFKDFRIIEKLQGGMMNESYLFFADGKNYVLYLPTTQANEMVDRFLEKQSQKIVMGIGITSNNFIFDEKTGIKINEYIDGKSLNYVNNIDTDQIASMLHLLHKGDKTLVEYNPFSRLENIINERKTFVDKFSKEEEKLLNVVLENRTFLENEDVVLSHNDFQRSNIILNNEGKYLVIDFEFMANNFETYDIACFANNDINDGELLLKSYKKDCIIDEDFKRFYLWRIFISLQWHNVALIKHFRGEGEKHNINFLDVSKHFIDNAKLAYEKYKAI